MILVENLHNGFFLFCLSQVVGPKKEKLAEAEAELAVQMGKLNEKRAELKEVSDARDLLNPIGKIIENNSLAEYSFDYMTLHFEWQKLTPPEFQLEKHEMQVEFMVKKNKKANLKVLRILFLQYLVFDCLKPKPNFVFRGI